VDDLFTQGYFEKFFRTIGFLGNGSNGSVFKVEHMLNDISLGVFALKKITIGTDERLLERTLKEVKMLSRITAKSRNLVNYNHVWFEVDRINEFGPRVPCAFILEQYYPGGNLEDLINDLKSPSWTVKDLKKHKHKKPIGRYLTNKEIFYMFRDIARGLAELHRNFIIHRDLKPSNILLNAAYLPDKYQNQPDLENLPTVVIGDFGESQFLDEKRSGTGFTGTIEYSAPEVFLYQRSGMNVAFSQKTDMFSMGMILHFLCFSELPSSAISAAEWDEMIKRNRIDDDELDSLHKRTTEFEIMSREGLHPRFGELIRHMTSGDPALRFSSEKLLVELDMLEDMISRDEEVYAELESSLTTGEWDWLWLLVTLVQVLELGYLLKSRLSQKILYPLIFINGALMNNPKIHKLILVITMSILLSISLFPDSLVRHYIPLY
jgi:serine/threonine protein kinase